jgi:DMSO/TMAO reductase YedYZ molybdopterin-dependent catalytic subunit
MNQGFRTSCMPIVMAALSFIPGRAAAQTDTVLTVSGDVERPCAFTMAAFAGLPHASVRAKGHDARASEFDGVLLTEILKRAGVRFGPDVRERITSAVILRATDGYQAVFSLAELDTAFTDRRIVLADRKDGKPITGSDGPLRMVVPGEKEHARWVRKVASLVVRRL